MSNVTILNICVVRGEEGVKFRAPTTIVWKLADKGNNFDFLWLDEKLFLFLCRRDAAIS